MDRYLHSSVNRIIVFFAALVMAVWVTSVTAQQYCGADSAAQAVQVKFADCGDVPDNASVYIGDNIGELLPLTKAASGYWEADGKFEPAKLKLCSHTCRSASGCARFSKTVAINRGSKEVCAARTVIQCTEQAWNLHVNTEPSSRLVDYKRLKPNRDGR